MAQLCHIHALQVRIRFQHAANTHGNMAFFSILRGNTPDQKLVVKSVLTPVLFLAMARGEIWAEQRALLTALCQSSPLFDDMTDHEVEDTIDRVETELAENDPDEMIPNAISVLSAPLRETSLAIAISVSTVEGSLTEDQLEVVELLAKQMAVSTKTVASLCNAAAMLQRGAVAA